MICTKTLSIIWSVDSFNSQTTNLFLDRIDNFIFKVIVYYRILMKPNHHSTKHNSKGRNVIDYLQSEKIHLCSVMLGIALQPISTATGNIGFGIALGFTLFRIPLLIPSWRTLAVQTWFRFLTVWLAWSILSLLWSSDWGFGLMQFKATRVLLWIPILWPLRHRWWPLISSILIGTTLTQFMQAYQIYFHWPLTKFGTGAGLTTATQTSLWDAIAVGFWLMLAVLAGWKMAFATLPAAILAASGLVWAGTRAAALALVVELIGSIIVIALINKQWIKRVIICALVGISILTGVYFLPHSKLSTKISNDSNASSITLADGYVVNANVRVAMWKMALEGWTHYPIFGVGIGGIPNTIAKNIDAKDSRIEVDNRPFDLSTVNMIHNTYIQILTESGIVGMGLFVAFIITFFAGALQSVQKDPVFIMTLGASMLWFVAASFDGFFNSGGFLSVGAIVLTLSIRSEVNSDLRQVHNTDARLL